MLLPNGAHERAQASLPIRLVPVDVETWASISTSASFGPFEAGARITVICSAAAHINAGASDVAATAANPQLPIGVHDFVAPDVEGGAYVALFGAGSGSGVAFEVG